MSTICYIHVYTCVCVVVHTCTLVPDGDERLELVLLYVQDPVEAPDLPLNLSAWITEPGWKGQSVCTGELCVFTLYM